MTHIADDITNFDPAECDNGFSKHRAKEDVSSSLNEISKPSDSSSDEGIAYSPTELDVPEIVEKKRNKAMQINKCDQPHIKIMIEGGLKRRPKSKMRKSELKTRLSDSHTESGSKRTQPSRALHMSDKAVARFVVKNALIENSLARKKKPVWVEIAKENKKANDNSRIQSKSISLLCRGVNQVKISGHQNKNPNLPSQRKPEKSRLKDHRTLITMRSQERSSHSREKANKSDVHKCPRRVIKKNSSDLLVVKNPKTKKLKCTGNNGRHCNEDPRFSRNSERNKKHLQPVYTKDINDNKEVSMKKTKTRKIDLLRRSLSADSSVRDLSYSSSSFNSTKNSLKRSSNSLSSRIIPTSSSVSSSSSMNFRSSSNVSTYSSLSDKLLKNVKTCDRREKVRLKTRMKLSDQMNRKLEKNDSDDTDSDKTPSLRYSKVNSQRTKKSRILGRATSCETKRRLPKIEHQTNPTDQQSSRRAGREKKSQSSEDCEEEEFEVNLARRNRNGGSRFDIEDGDLATKVLHKTHWQHQRLVLTSQRIGTHHTTGVKTPQVEETTRVNKLKPFAATNKNDVGIVHTIRDLYSLHHVLSDTQNGTVIAGHRRIDGLRVAIKRIAKAGTTRWGWMNGKVVPLELALICQVNEVRHPGVVEIVEWHETTEAFLLVMVRPHPSVDLYDHVTKHKRLKESVVRRIIQQIVLSLLHCNKMGVLHRDVKLENILFNPVAAESILIDFGCGDYHRAGSYKEFAGTPEYYPPEWFLYKQYSGDAATVWSIGVLMYSMLCGTLPFRSSKDIINKDLTKFPADTSDCAKRLIAQLLRKNPPGRMELGDILSHKFFKNSRNKSESRKVSL